MSIQNRSDGQTTTEEGSEKPNLMIMEDRDAWSNLKQFYVVEKAGINKLEFYRLSNSNLFFPKTMPISDFSRPIIMDSNAPSARDPQANEVFDDGEDDAAPSTSGSSPETNSVEDRPTAWVFPHTTARDRGQLPIPDDGPTRAYIWAPKNMHRDRGAMVRMILRRQLFRTFTAVAEVDHNMFADRKRLRDIIKSNPNVQMIEMSTETRDDGSFDQPAPPP